MYVLFGPVKPELGVILILTLQSNNFFKKKTKPVT